MIFPFERFEVNTSHRYLSPTHNPGICTVISNGLLFLIFFRHPSYYAASTRQKSCKIRFKMTRISDSDMPTALGISQTVYLLFRKLWDVTITGGQDDVTYFNGIDFSTYKLSRNTPYQTHSKSVNSAKTCLRTGSIDFFPFVFNRVQIEKGLQFWPILGTHDHWAARVL